MIHLLLLATAAISAGTIAPITVNFTSDSVYTKESIIKPKELIQEEDSELYTIVLEEDHLLGYCIYDKSDTAYIDGLKFDDAYVTNWIVEHVDLSVEHTLHVKTVYTDDTAGMLAAAKDGDWSRVLSNPLIIIQMFYYLLAATSVIAGGLGLAKSRKNKAKTVAEISKESEANAMLIVSEIVVPVFKKLQLQNQKVIEALVLSQSEDKESKVALINLLEETAVENIEDISTSIKSSITKAMEAKDVAKEKAKQVIKELSQDIREIKKDSEEIIKDIGGISI